MHYLLDEGPVLGLHALEDLQLMTLYVHLPAAPCMRTK